MGNDEQTTDEAFYLTYWNKKQLFHIVGNDFPLIEEGIVGLDFFKKYKNYSITKTDLIVEKWKLPLHSDEYIQGKTSKVLKIKTTEKENQIVWIEGQEKVPDGLHTIYNQEIEVPYYNYNPKPEKKPEKIIYERITSICSWF